jgi:hypothetical protein
VWLARNVHSMHACRESLIVLAERTRLEWFVKTMPHLLRGEGLILPTERVSCLGYKPGIDLTNMGCEVGRTPLRERGPTRMTVTTHLSVSIFLLFVNGGLWTKE